MVAQGAWTRFALILGIFVLGAVLTHRNPLLIRALAPFDRLTAQATAAVLDWHGMEVIREDVVLSHPSGFGYEIYYRCTGLLPAAFLAVGVFAFPIRLRLKLVGIAIGVPLIFSLNLIRLASLFYIGVWHPSLFDLAHTVIWESLLLLSIVGFWLWWMRSVSTE
jgi:exosortase H (IPTLxxWG-CTERM-specific)